MGRLGGPSSNSKFHSFYFLFFFFNWNDWLKDKSECLYLTILLALAPTVLWMPLRFVFLVWLVFVYFFLKRGLSSWNISYSMSVKGSKQANFAGHASALYLGKWCFSCLTVPDDWRFYLFKLSSNVYSVIPSADFNLETRPFVLELIVRIKRCNSK